MSKVNFGKYAILDEVTYNFKLEPEWWWKIKPATTKNDIVIQQLVMANKRFIRDIDGNPIELPPTTGEIMLYEAVATFGGTNIPNPENLEELYISDDISSNNLLQKINDLPFGLLDELWDAIGESNPHLGPRRLGLGPIKKQDKQE